MPVHANSVISVWINSYDSAFYTAITDQENEAYIDDELNWKPLFTSLNSAMTTFKNIARGSHIREFIPVLYSYRVLNTIYATDGSLLATSDGRVIHNMNGFIPACKGRASTYYDDLDPGLFTSAKMSADITTIGGSAAVEISTIEGLQASMQGVIASKMNQLLFEDVTPSGPFPGKSGMATYVFNTIHWKEVYQQLNVSPLTLPPGV